LCYTVLKDVIAILITTSANPVWIAYTTKASEIFVVGHRHGYSKKWQVEGVGVLSATIWLGFQ
jgi:hypothetical protein